MAQVTVVEARIFTVYFEGPDLMDEAACLGHAGEVYSCKVVAGTTEEAIRKAHEAFPGKPIDSVFIEKPEWYGNAKPPSRDKIVY